jgi:hypothetical protein
LLSRTLPVEDAIGVTMKLRLFGDSLRLRLTPENVEQLIQTGTVRESTCFASGAELVYCLCVSAEVKEIGAMFDPGGICVRMPGALAARWAKTPEVGISEVQKFGGGRSLKILIEKDFQCLDTTKDEPGIALYPNPRASTNSM